MYPPAQACHLRHSALMALVLVFFRTRLIDRTHRLWYDDLCNGNSNMSSITWESGDLGALVLKNVIMHRRTIFICGTAITDDAMRRIMNSRSTGMPSFPALKVYSVVNKWMISTTSKRGTSANIVEEESIIISYRSMHRIHV